jgi:predicted porin
MNKGLIASVPVLGAALVGAAVAWPTVASARDEVRLHPKLNGRVNELEQELRIMKNRMKAIERRQSGSKSSGRSVTRKSKKVQVIISGQVHRAVLFGSTRQNTEILHVDGDQSNTRLRLQGIANTAGGWKIEALIEFEMENNDSNGTRDATPNFDDLNFRKLRIRFSHKKYGAISIGREDTATNGIAELDLSGGKVAMYADVETVGGGFVHVNAVNGVTGSGGGIATGQTVAASWNQFDGSSRRDLIRYDTPKFFGFWISVSHANGDRLSAAIRYVGSFFGLKDFKLAAGFGYDYLPGEGASAPGSAFIAGDATGPRQQYAGSVSVLHKPSGLSITFSAGTQVQGGGARENPWSVYTKLGWQTKALLPRIGKTIFMADAFYSREIAAVGDRFKGFGIGAVQNIDSASTAIYVVYRLYDLHKAGLASRGQSTIHVVMVGSRLKF